MRTKLGIALLLVAGVLVFAVATRQTFAGYLLSAVAVLGLAAGALLSGLGDRDGRPV